MTEAEKLEKFLQSYCSNVARGFHSRWDSYTPEIYDNEISETIGGLSARQATLAIEMAQNPGIWNGHLAPLVLRCMSDAYITLAWILEKPMDRCREYVRYGLGQEKLYLEYLKNESETAPEGELDERIEELIEIREAWLNSQLMEWAIEVNVGSWSGTSVREMAIEAGCESIYKFAYVPFSGAAHNMWHHVGNYNVVQCSNPLHKNHRIPLIWSQSVDPDYLYRSAKYISRSFRLLDDKLGLASEIKLPVEYFVDHFPRNDMADESAS
jgi:hypothetical protein